MKIRLETDKMTGNFNNHSSLASLAVMFFCHQDFSKSRSGFYAPNS